MILKIKQSIWWYQVTKIHGYVFKLSYLSELHMGIFTDQMIYLTLFQNNLGVGKTWKKVQIKSFRLWDNNCRSYVMGTWEFVILLLLILYTIGTVYDKMLENKSVSGIQIK